MKKSILVISLTVILALGAFAQEQPKPAKDTVNMDTNAKPEVYYAVEDDKADVKSVKEKKATLKITIIAGAIIIVGAAAFLLLKKKKQ
jgi:beta-lactamase regulating signal transducer with metallopeptidase domain